MAIEPISVARDRAQMSASGIGAAFHHRASAMQGGDVVDAWRAAVTVTDGETHKQILVGLRGADPFLAIDEQALADLVEEAAEELQGDGGGDHLARLVAAAQDDPVVGLDLGRFDPDALSRISSRAGAPGADAGSAGRTAGG
jgi:hypothetical protein